MRMSDWSSDVCSSDLGFGLEHAAVEIADDTFEGFADVVGLAAVDEGQGDGAALGAVEDDVVHLLGQRVPRRLEAEIELAGEGAQDLHVIRARRLRLGPGRSEEHTSELQSLMRTSYAV